MSTRKDTVETYNGDDASREMGRRGAAAWQTDGYGSGAIAMCGKHVAFLGSYDHPNRLYLCALTDVACVCEREYDLALASGDSIRGHLLAARGSALAFLADGMISRMDIANLPAQL